MNLEQIEAHERRKLLHDCYVEMTGCPASFIQREFVWADWARRGLDIQDLRRWINAIQKRILRRELDRRSLMFTNLISNLDRAEENCLELRRIARGHVPDTDRDSVMRSAGMTKALNTDSTQSVSEVIRKVIPNPEAAAKAFKELQQLKQSL